MPYSVCLRCVSVAFANAGQMGAALRIVDDAMAQLGAAAIDAEWCPNAWHRTETCHTQIEHVPQVCAIVQGSSARAACSVRPGPKTCLGLDVSLTHSGNAEPAAMDRCLGGSGLPQIAERIG